MSENLLNVKEVSILMNVSQQTVRNWITNYEKGLFDKPYYIKPVRIGRKVFINQNELDNFNNRYVR